MGSLDRQKEKKKGWTENPKGWLDSKEKNKMRSFKLKIWKDGLKPKSGY